MKITGAEILIKCLIEQGVDTVFGYPGGAVLNIYDELYRYSDKINHVLTCHEQGAAHAADGYARASGKTGVVLATSGPGATNLVTGIATAYMDSVPLVAITGNVNMPLLGKDSFQEVDIAGITMPVTKHSCIVRTVESLAETIRQAFYIAKSGRPGPVLVDIPKDITAALCEYTEEKPQEYSFDADKISEERIDTAAEIIKKAKKPFIYAGGGVIASGASQQLVAFAEKIGAPVANSLMGLGSVDCEHRLYTGMIGMHGTRVSALCVTECDLLIAIGTRFSDRVATKPDTFAKNAKIIHIDIDAAEINKNVRVTQSVLGDVKAVLQKLMAKINTTDTADWQKELAQWKQLYKIDQPKKGEVMPQKILEEASRLAKGKAIFTTEVGQHQMWAAQYVKPNGPRTFISSGGLGTMGFGFGAAIGAQTAMPQMRVINVAGDGSFHMNLNEFATAVTYNLPVIILLMNNNVLGMVRQWQKLFYQKRYMQTTLNRKTDYIALAQAFGAKGFTIEAEADIEPVLKQALACDGPCIINCIVNEDVNVLPMVPAGAEYSSIIYELEE